MGAVELLAICRQQGDFVAGEDGFWLFWPTRNNGGLTDWMARAIADELERLNAPVQEEWERRVATLEQPQ